MRFTVKNAFGDDILCPSRELDEDDVWDSQRRLGCFGTFMQPRNIHSHPDIDLNACVTPDSDLANQLANQPID